MTIEQFKNLHPALQSTINVRAIQRTEKLEQYLSKKAYCILRTNGKIEHYDDTPQEYVSFPLKRHAKEYAKANMIYDYKIITFDEAIEYLDKWLKALENKQWKIEITCDIVWADNALDAVRDEIMSSDWTQQDEPIIIEDEYYSAKITQITA